MQDKTVIIVSGSVDATIKEYQSDVDFRIYHALEDLGADLDKLPIRAQTLFFTKDVVGQTNSAFSYVKDLCLKNDYLVVDKVVYITEEDSPELISLNYIIEEFELSNWEVVTGSLSRAFVAEVINGTFRGDHMNVRRKAVYRVPRSDYVKTKLKENKSLDEDYIDDETDLGNIPDEDVPKVEPVKRESHLKRVYIAGLDGLERTAFTFLAAQYLALSERTLLIECDPEYHRLTEFATKSQIAATVIYIEDLYADVSSTLERIRLAKTNLVILECVERFDFDYRFVCQVLYYNLVHEFEYMLYEIPLEGILQNVLTTVVVPSTVIGCLQTGEAIDRSFVDDCKFVGVNLKQVPEIHINSGTVMATILADVLTTPKLICPVVTISSLKLLGSAYDLGGLLGKEVIS